MEGSEYFNMLFKIFSFERGKGEKGFCISRMWTENLVNDLLGTAIIPVCKFEIKLESAIAKSFCCSSRDRKTERLRNVAQSLRSGEGRRDVDEKIYLINISSRK